MYIFLQINWNKHKYHTKTRTDISSADSNTHSNSPVDSVSSDDFLVLLAISLLYTWTQNKTTCIRAHTHAWMKKLLTHFLPRPNINLMQFETGAYQYTEKKAHLGLNSHQN